MTNQNKTVIGGAQGAPAPDESLMLTGDENIVDLSFTVQWHISDAAAYLFEIRDPRRRRQGGGRERHARGRRPQRR